MDSQLHLVAIFFALISFSGFVWAHLEGCWKISSDELAVQPFVICYGLWKICTGTEGMSVFTCDGYFGKTILEFQTPARLHYARATLMGANILTGIGLFLLGIGGACCKVNSLGYDRKRSYRCIACWMFLVSGLAVMSSACWYAAIIYKERQWYWDTGTFGSQFKWGRGLYLAWGSSITAFLAGIAASCCTSNGCGLLCGMSSEEEPIGYYPNEKKKLQSTLESNHLMTEYI